MSISPHSSIKHGSIKGRHHNRRKIYSVSSLFKSVILDHHFPMKLWLASMLLIVALPVLFSFVFPVVLALLYIHKKKYLFRLPIMMPGSASKHYEVDPGRTTFDTVLIRTGLFSKEKRTITVPDKPAGIFYVGNHKETNEEIWYDLPLLSTHFSFIATTGGGKTFGFTSMMMNFVICSGFIYSDAKADLGLVENFSRIAFRVGRINDLQVISFQAGNRSPWQISKRSKISHTFAPFNSGSAPMIIETFKALSDGDGDIWAKRADNLSAAELKPLVYMRDKFSWPMGFGVIAEYFELEKLGELASVGLGRHEKYEIPDEDKKFFEPLVSFVKNLPGLTSQNFEALITGDKAGCMKITPTTRDQLGYVTMQLVNITNDLIGDYGHIFECSTSQIDLSDAIFNRRLVVNLLPAMERSEGSMARLGQIVLIGQKAAIANGMPYELEGDLSAHIASMPVAADYSLGLFNDEAGSFLVESVSAIPAQARSLRASFAIGGQDIPGMKKRSEQIAKEVDTILGTTVTKLIGSTLDKETIDWAIHFADEEDVLVSNEVQLKGHGFTSRGKEETLRHEKEKVLNVKDIADQGPGEVILMTRHDINKVQLPSYITKETNLPLSNFYLYETVSVYPKPAEEIELRRNMGRNFDRLVFKARNGVSLYKNIDQRRHDIFLVEERLNPISNLSKKYMEDKASAPSAQKLFLRMSVFTAFMYNVGQEAIKAAMKKYHTVDDTGFEMPEEHWKAAIESTFGCNIDDLIDRLPNKQDNNNDTNSYTDDSVASESIESPATEEEFYDTPSIDEFSDIGERDLPHAETLHSTEYIDDEAEGEVVDTSGEGNYSGGFSLSLVPEDKVLDIENMLHDVDLNSFEHTEYYDPKEESDTGFGKQEQNEATQSTADIFEAAIGYDVDVLNSQASLSQALKALKAFKDELKTN